MSQERKYIVIDNGMYEEMITFNGARGHDQMAKTLGGEVVSAGFIIHDGTQFVCYGESVSLEVKSRPKDTDIANRDFGD